MSGPDPAEGKDFRAEMVKNQEAQGNDLERHVRIGRIGRMRAHGVPNRFLAFLDFSPFRHENPYPRPDRGLTWVPISNRMRMTRNNCTHFTTLQHLFMRVQMPIFGRGVFEPGHMAAGVSPTPKNPTLTLEIGELRRRMQLS